MDRGKEIFVLKINLQQDFDYIRVCENDEPLQLAKDFISKHKLCISLQTHLSEEIEKNIDKLMRTSPEPANLTLDTSFNNFAKQIGTESLSKFRTTTSFKNSRFLSPSNFFSQAYQSSVKSLSPHKSKNVIDKVRLFRFQSVFRYLNPDEHGKVTVDQLEQFDMTSKVYKILLPILAEIKEKNLKLNYRGFCEKMEELMRKLSTEEKYFILSSNLHIPLFVLPNRHRGNSPLYYRHRLRNPNRLK